MSDKPCSYCGYMPNLCSRQHASSCPTHEIEDLERRLDEFERRVMQLEPENADLSDKLSKAEQDKNELVMHLDIEKRENAKLRADLTTSKLQWRNGKIPSNGFYLLRYDNIKYLRPEYLEEGLMWKAYWPESLEWAGPIQMPRTRG